MELQQGGCVRKADVEFRMPLEDTASITDPPVVPTQLICTWIFICSITKLKEQSREICYVVPVPPVAVAILELGNSALNSHEKVMHKEDTGPV